MDSKLTDEVGSKTKALANARHLLRNGQYQEAAEQAHEVIEGDEDCAEAHRLLGMALRQLGDIEGARLAESQAIELSLLHPDIFQATMALADGRLDRAEKLLRPHLKEYPDDAAALRLLAEVGARTGHLDAADSFARKALQVAPDYVRARELLEKVSAARQDAASGESRASVILPTGEAQYAEALEVYEKVVAKFPDAPENWTSYGHVLRTVGSQDEAVAAYRRAIELRPDSGAAWWALADLKTRPLRDEDIAQLEKVLEGDIPDENNRSSIHFALGRALEQAGRFDRSFEQYAEANRLKSATSGHDRAAVSRHVDASLQLFDVGFFESRRGAGFDGNDPIFILGMPRAGSTLIEQILSCHRDVEGTMELGDLPAIARWLGDGRHAGFEDSNYLARLAALPPVELGKLGQGYLWGTRLRRQSDKPFFTDKMPNNWLHIGMILTILPNAKIIDARRHPLACGLSLFRQNFARGQDFSYDLADIGSLYADYVRMMEHFDRIMPGRIIRVIHEDLVADSEGEIQKLLDRLELPFDERCLNFHESRRAVRTSSSEQVRRPINREGVDQWRAFEPWLGPLKRVLGSIADEYPAVPHDLVR
ncbi:sulfotransferase [Sphingomonas sp. G124]|uniref:Sulfotransferase n=1 Tax=Sphingomonas cremea TaxID=2904799 RepID=A0A9X1TWI4_9SPHN|nr:tetratricopeptide repeat-containing sulfotransferase family protein [Sphingomonas cremea]MCF2514105.1 sulfotransferase [Sphingomonas cremea]